MQTYRKDTEHLSCGGRQFGQRKRFAGFDNEFLLVHFAQAEEKFRLMVEAGTDAVEHCRHLGSKSVNDVAGLKCQRCPRPGSDPNIWTLYDIRPLLSRRSSPTVT
jgi:hypothetical protein